MHFRPTQVVSSMYADFHNPPPFIPPPPPPLCPLSPLSPNTCSVLAAQIAAAGLQGGVHAKEIRYTAKDIVERQRSIRCVCVCDVRAQSLWISLVRCGWCIAFQGRAFRICEYVHRCASISQSVRVCVQLCGCTHSKTFGHTCTPVWTYLHT